MRVVNFGQPNQMGVPSLRAIRSTNLYWAEKFILIIDFLQIYALLWICAQPWPWPYLWIYWTRWSPAFNVDIFSYTPNGALGGQSSNIGMSPWGQLNGYLYYALGFAMVELCLLLGLGFCYRRFGTYGKKWTKYRSSLIAGSLAFAHLFYLPFSLAVLRLYHCDDHGRMSADPTVTCSSAAHSAISVICSLIHLPLMFLVPYWTYRQAEECRIYDLPEDHEKRLQCWEILYMLGASDDWLDLQCWVMSSFRRCGYQFRSHMLILKALLLINFVAIRMSLVLQAFIFLLLHSAFSIYYGFLNPPFRCMSTNRILFVLIVLITVDASFGLANSANVRNSIMVASSESISLLAVNVIGAACILCIMILVFWSFRVLWPANRTLNRIVQDPRLNALVVQWVQVITHCTTVKINFLKSNDVVRDILELEDCIRVLRQCWLAASASGSIFTLPLNEAVEEMLVIYQSNYHASLRRHDHWEKAYQEASEGGIFAERDRNYALMAPRKRRIFSKLFALRALMGASNNPKFVDDESEDGQLQVGFGDETEINPESEEKINSFTDYIKDLEDVCEAKLNRKDYGSSGQGTSLQDKKQFEELYFKWDEIISSYENETLIGQPSAYTDIQVENWYTYRALLGDVLREVKWDVENILSVDMNV